MRRQLLPAVRIVLAMTVVVGLVYPLVITGVAQALFRDEANGSLVEVDGQVVGSSLLGQAFSGPGYFWTRPSAAGILATGSLDDEGQPADPSDLSNANSSGSNYGPTNDVFLYGQADDPETPDEDEASDGVQQLAAAYREAHGMAADAQVPVDAVTSSGSGLDPHISVANARIQANRVAAERGLDPGAVTALIDGATDGRPLGFLGEPGVNVLALNLAVDRLARTGP